MQREGRGQRDVLVRNTRDVNWGWHCRQYDFATCPCHYRSCKNATTPNAATSVRFPAVPALFGLSISRRQRNIFLSLFRCCCCCRACLSEKLEPRMLCTGQLWGLDLCRRAAHTCKKLPQLPLTHFRAAVASCGGSAVLQKH